MGRPSGFFNGFGFLCLKPSLLPSDQYEALIANNLGHSGSRIGYFVTTSPSTLIEDLDLSIAVHMIMTDGQTLESRLQGDGVSIPMDSFEYIYIPLSSNLVAECSTLYVTLFGELYVSGNDEEEMGAIYEEKIIASQALDISQVHFQNVEPAASQTLWEYTGNDIQLTLTKPTLQDYSDYTFTTYDTDPQNGITIEISEAQHTIDVTGLTATIPSGGNESPTGSVGLDLKYSLTGYYATVLPTFWLKLVDSNGDAVDISTVENAVISFTNNGMTKVGIVDLDIPWEFDRSNETFSFYPDVTFDHIVLSFCFFCPGKGLVKKDYTLNLSMTADSSESEPER